MINKYLTGKCLVSMPNIEDERFQNSVVYICSHNQKGAMGFVINKRLENFYFSDLVSLLNVSPNNMMTDDSIILYQGGPLEKIRGFILHSREYVQAGTVVMDGEIAISASINVLNDIAVGNGPKYNLIALGYSSWSPKQLEQELIDNVWLVADATSELLFRTGNEDRWQKAVDSLGFDINRISLKTGRA
jgi:putative transcriptional regulator